MLRNRRLVKTKPSRRVYESRVRSSRVGFRRLNENEYVKTISSMKIDDDSLQDIANSIVSVKDQMDQDFRVFCKKMVNFLSDPVSYVGGGEEDVEWKLEKIDEAINNLAYALEDLTNL